MSKVRLLLADDHPMFRQGLRRLLEMEPDMEVVGEAGDGREAGERALELKPDVILMDIDMPQVDGLHATRNLLRRQPSARVIMLTVFGERDKVLQAIGEGVRGYVLKSADSSELVAAIRAVYGGQDYLSPAAAQALAEEWRQLRSGVSLLAQRGVSPREREVLSLLAQGLTNEEIGRRLFVSAKTVRNHLTALFRKIGVRNRTEATLFALSHGLSAHSKPPQS